LAGTTHATFAQSAGAFRNPQLSPCRNALWLYSYG
jgi:hypothetical protein